MSDDPTPKPQDQPAPPADPPAKGDPPAEPSADTVESLRAKLEEQKQHSRTWETRAKENKDAAKKLKELETAHMNEQEKAVAEAKEAGRKEALAEAGSSLVEAEIKAAAAGRAINIDALLEGVDRSRFLNDEGRADSAAVKAWVDKMAPAGAAKPQVPDLGQGNLGDTPDPDAATVAAFAKGIGLAETKKE